MSVYTMGKAGLPQPGLDAAREGRYFYGWVNSKTNVATLTVLTDAGLISRIEPGKRYVVVMFYMNMSTLSDWVTCEWGVTQYPDGSGTFTPRTPRFRIDTGNVQSGRQPTFTHMDYLPIVLTSANGAAWTARVQGNDAAATFTLGFNGWWELDTGVN